MKIVINIQNKHVMLILLFIIAASAATIVFGYGSSNPPIMGHSWGEIECSGCISTSNLADNSVTSAKIQDGTITTSDVATIDGSKITGTVANADTIDGKHLSQLEGLLGSTVPASTTCPCHDEYGRPIVATLRPLNLIINNNRFALLYYWTGGCIQCSMGYECKRYYFGNGEWSNCIEIAESCNCPLSGA